MSVRLCPWKVGQIYAPRQLLLRCSTKRHPCRDAIPALLPSMAVVGHLAKAALAANQVGHRQALNKPNPESKASESGFKR